MRPVGPGETKAGSWAVWADPALVSDAAISSSDGLTNRTSQALLRKYIFANNFSLAHLGNSRKQEADIGMRPT